MVPLAVQAVENKKAQEQRLEQIRQEQQRERQELEESINERMQLPTPQELLLEKGRLQRLRQIPWVTSLYYFAALKNMANIVNKVRETKQKDRHR